MSEENTSPLRFLRSTPGLFAFDLDSTLVDGEGIDELARAIGVYDSVAAITEKAMRGEIDFTESFQARLALLKGLSLADVDTAYDRIPLMPGAIDVFNALRNDGHRIAILSGGFDLLAERYIRDLGGVDYLAINTLELEDGFCTGRAIPPIIDAEGKAKALVQAAQELGIPLSRTVAIGDGANDIPMLKTAACGIAFRGKPALRAVAQAVVEEKDLMQLLQLF
jgi:phosphoserine phosphatase